MLFLDRPSTHWLDVVELAFLLKTTFWLLVYSGRERKGRAPLPSVSSGWLREHEIEAAKRGG